MNQVIPRAARTLGFVYTYVQVHFSYCFRLTSIASSPNPTQSEAVGVGALAESSASSAGLEIPDRPSSSTPEVPPDVCHGTTSPNTPSKDSSHTQICDTSATPHAGNDDSGTTLIPEDRPDLGGIALQEDPTPGEFSIPLVPGCPKMTILQLRRLLLLLTHLPSNLRRQLSGSHNGVLASSSYLRTVLGAHWY